MTPMSCPLPRLCDPYREFGPPKAVRLATRDDRCPKVFLSAVALDVTVWFWLIGDENEL